MAAMPFSQNNPMSVPNEKPHYLSYHRPTARTAAGYGPYGNNPYATRAVSPYRAASPTTPSPYYAAPASRSYAPNPYDVEPYVSRAYAPPSHAANHTEAAFRSAMARTAAAYQPRNAASPRRARHTASPFPTPVFTPAYY